MNEECENCPYRGHCDMQCYNEYSVYWTPEDDKEDDN